MRLIDADVLKEMVPTTSVDMFENCRNCSLLSEEQVLELIDMTPTVDMWIPCSERLPKENAPVNITWVNRNPVSYYADIKDIPFTATGVYYEGKWYWWSSIVEDLLAEYGRTQWDRIVELMDESIEVLAWMPLPKPYREDGE